MSCFAEQRHHKAYLGREFTKAFEEVECAYVGSACFSQVSVFALTLMTVISRVLA